MNIEEMRPGRIYTFQTHSPVFLGATVKNAKLIGSGNLALAKTIAPIEQIYAAVFPSLPEGEYYSPEEQVYYIFEEMNGDRRALAGQWIVQGSVEEYTVSKLTITIFDNNADVNKASRALRAAGFVNIKIKSE